MNISDLTCIGWRGSGLGFFFLLYIVGSLVLFCAMISILIANWLADRKKRKSQLEEKTLKGGKK